MDQFQKYAPLISRLFIGGFFLISGVSKLGNVEGFTGYLQMGGLPGFLAWPAIAFEIAVGLSMLLGFQARLVALAGAGFCIVTAVLYHSNFADPTMQIMFLKNFAIAGGFLMIFASGAGPVSLDKAKAA